MNNGKVKCNNCQNEVSPKLWHHNSSSLLFKRKNEHMCSVCGVTMYTTGGGLTIFGICLTVFFGIGFLLSSVAIPLTHFFKSIGFNAFFADIIVLFILTFAGFVFYKWKKRTSR